MKRIARYWWLGLIVAVVIAGGSFEWWTARIRQESGTAVVVASPATTYVRRETRPTLDPARFVGKAAATHRIAREIPDVLDQLYCYCECDKSIGHKSLLSCYTDGHAAT